jgi:hypothetical protein
MILKAGKDRKRLPEAVDDASTWLAVYDVDPRADPHARLEVCERVNDIRLFRTHLGNAVPPPRMRYAISRVGAVYYLEVFPAPKSDKHAVFRYCPPMKEI